MQLDDELPGDLNNSNSPCVLYDYKNIPGSHTKLSRNYVFEREPASCAEELNAF